jgi:hypothetical protein
MTKIVNIGLPIKKILLLILLIIVFLSCGIPAVSAQSRVQSITIVNPVRLNRGSPLPEQSLMAEYRVIKNSNLPATWLFTFEALKDKGVLLAVKNMDQKQEFGIFLEVTSKFAQAAGVEYHDTGFWHHSNSIFLSGYTQDERIKLIDTVFGEFKKVFANYPTSVGSWWTDSFSLSYMKDKYGITANLGCADQFSTDGYQLWGQYWSTPFYPSRFHAGIPASDPSVKLDLVTIQWALRDPLNGYYSSLFSTQDYSLNADNLKFDYFQKLIKIYDQVTVGLESDLSPEAYAGEYQKQIDYVSELQKKGEAKTMTMKDFSSWYRKEYPNLSPAVLIKADDLLGTGKKITWYQSPFYRIGIYYFPDGGETEIIDLRIYNQDIYEPYYSSPNREFGLFINTPSVFDKADSQLNIWKIKGRIESEFQEDSFTLKGELGKIPNVLDSSLFSLKKEGDKLTVKLNKGWITKGLGKVVRDYSSEAIHFFKQVKFPLLLLSGQGWQYFQKVNYLIPTGELEALEKLAFLPKGRVLVFDNECLQCEFHTPFKPPAFANLRSYVRKYAKHSIVYNSSVFKVKTQKEAKKEFDKLNVRYVYLVKFEGYIERLPFSPGDLGVEKIFENANAQVWVVK